MAWTICLFCRISLLEKNNFVPWCWCKDRLSNWIFSRNIDSNLYLMKVSYIFQIKFFQKISKITLSQRRQHHLYWFFLFFYLWDWHYFLLSFPQWRLRLCVFVEVSSFLMDLLKPLPQFGGLLNQYSQKDSDLMREKTQGDHSPSDLRSSVCGGFCFYQHKNCYYLSFLGEIIIEKF